MNLKHKFIDKEKKISLDKMKFNKHSMKMQKSAF